MMLEILLMVFAFAIFPFGPFHAFGLEERMLPTAWEQSLRPFLDGGKTFTFKGANGLPLQGRYFPNPKSRETLLILTGFTEPYLKYAELFYDLHEAGYAILTYDHRGQGLSPRLSHRSPEIAHVQSFQEYSDDLGAFTETVLKSDEFKGKPLSLIAHSMGGAVALHYLETHPASPFRKIILNAPMLEIRTDPYPRILARALVHFMGFLGFGDAFAPGYHAFYPDRGFDSNQTTGSRARFELENRIAALNPKAFVGGPSNHWVEESLISSQNIAEHLDLLHQPYLMLTAAEDSFVVTEKLGQLCRKSAPVCTLFALPHGKHETFMETDSVRNEALNRIHSYLNP